MNALINYEKKAICILIPKNASSYLKHILCTYYGFHNLKVARNDFYHFCNYKLNELDSFLDIPYHYDYQIHYLVSKGIVRFYEGIDRKNKIYNVTDKYGKQFKSTHWKTFYKFTFVRNPYDRFISSFCYFKESSDVFRSFKFCTIKELINSYLFTPSLISGVVNSHFFISQSEHLMSDDRFIHINYIGKLETLEDDLTFALKEIGFRYVKIPDVKRINCSKGRETVTMDIDTLAFINHHFKTDFDNFKYEMYNTV